MQLNRISNMLLGIAIGDTFGAGYEFAYPKITDYANIDTKAYREHPNKNFKHAAGRYTDDTQMSIAVAELMLSNKPFTHLNLATRIFECYKRDPTIGYAKGFQAFLDSINSGEEFLEKIKPDSIRNGAAIRALPIGIHPNIETVIEYARINAEITHNTPKGIASSVFIALLAHKLLYDQSDIFYVDEEIINPHIMKIDNETASYLNEVWLMKELDLELLLGDHKNKGVPCDGMRTCGAALHAFTDYSTPFEVLTYSVLLGGDTDSTASVALGLKMIDHNVSGLPSFLFNDLDNGKYGRDYLIQLGKKLSEKYII
ncbi:MAG: ADP-ribosylglycohydrolase family protein [Candidatus Woesearchaeota archaeon]